MCVNVLENVGATLKEPMCVSRSWLVNSSISLAWEAAATIMELSSVCVCVCASRMRSMVNGTH